MGIKEGYGGLGALGGLGGLRGVLGLRGFGVLGTFQEFVVYGSFQTLGLATSCFYFSQVPQSLTMYSRAGEQMRTWELISWTFERSFVGKLQILTLL